MNLRLSNIPPWGAGSLGNYRGLVSPVANQFCGLRRTGAPRAAREAGRLWPGARSELNPPERSRPRLNEPRVRGWVSKGPPPPDHFPASSDALWRRASRRSAVQSLGNVP
jgi:hypothetical protein